MSQSMKQLLAALAAGALFGFGLGLSQMIDPTKVTNFLDLLGSWDPSLAFVMAGGLLVNALLTPLILKQKRPLLAEFFRLPTKAEIDKRLVIGGVVFGVGWGLAGYCPGPMITSLSFADSDILTVVMAFVVGTFAARWVLHRSS
ncbi:putative membrane protein YedE/YeeE [Marinobacterium sp. MBR-111]